VLQRPGSLTSRRNTTQCAAGCGDFLISHASAHPICGCLLPWAGWPVSLG